MVIPWVIHTAGYTLWLYTASHAIGLGTHTHMELPLINVEEFVVGISNLSTKTAALRFNNGVFTSQVCTCVYALRHLWCISSNVVIIMHTVRALCANERQ